MGEKRLCCEHLQFMWDNHLLEERASSSHHRTPEGDELFISFVKGYRVRRSFWFFKRDQVFYRCPFCFVELIFATGAFIPGLNFSYRGELQVIGMTSIEPVMKVPMSALKQALLETKTRNKTWPPKD